MATSSDDIYRQILSMQESVFTSHLEIKEEIENLKVAIHNRIAPIEEKVSRHEHTFSMLARTLTWILPSGVVLSIMGWLTQYFGTAGTHK